MKLATFFISSTRRIFTKLLSVSESSTKIKVRSHRTLFVILLTSVVICKQIHLHGNEIVEYLQNCACYNVGQDHFRKFCKVHEKELYLNNPYNFQRPFNFRVLLKVH